MRVAIIGSDVSALVVSWMLRNHAEVFIVEPGSELAGYHPTTNVKTSSGTTEIDHYPFVFESINDQYTQSLLSLLGLPVANIDVNSVWTLEGFFPTILKHTEVQQSLLHSCFSSHFSSLTTLSSSQQTSMSSWWHKLTKLSPAAVTAYDDDDQINDDPSSSTAPSWQGLVSSKSFIRKLAQQSFATTLFSSTVDKLVFNSNKGCEIFLCKGGTIQADHVIVCDSAFTIKHVSKQLNTLLPALHWHNINSILHTWPGVISSIEHAKNNLFCHVWKDHGDPKLGMSYALHQLGLTPHLPPLYLSHNSNFSIPNDYVYEQIPLSIINRDASFYSLQAYISALQGKQDVWFGGQLMHNGTIESCIRQARVLCNKIGVNDQF